MNDPIVDEVRRVRGEHAALAQHGTTVDEVLALATAPAPDTPSKWLDRDPDARR